MLALGAGVTGTLVMPDLLARGGVQGEHVSAARVDELQVQPPAVEHGGRSHAKCNLELAIAVLQVELPLGLTIWSEAADLAAAHRGPYVLAVGAWRGGRGIAFVAADLLIA